MDTVLEGLNVAQRTAVTSPSHVLQILAPPGSGKTKTLTSRVAYHLQHDNYKPWNIICLTFTIKSSREMRERIARILGNGVESRIILGTFHSVCRRYLVKYGHLIGVRKDFGIADTSDTISIIKRIIKRHSINIDAKKVQARISQSKSKGIGPAQLTHEQGQRKNIEQQDFTTVFEKYEEQLASSNLLDYDDLLLRCVDLLSRHPSCVSNIEAVLIDEFQDTNVVQFDLMRLFAAKNNRVTTVGDPDQSIYGWRSAEIKNLKRMQRQYPDTLVIHLEDNYRSSGAILLCAREVIEQDEARPLKPLIPTHCPGTIPVLRRLPSAQVEAAWVVTEIQRTIALTGNLLTYSDFAILLRSASLSRLLESAIGKAGIPYRMVGGHRFYDRAEIKILLDYLKVIGQPDNNDAVSRIVNVPPRGIGPETVRKLLEEAESRYSTLWQLLRDGLQGQTRTTTRLSKAAENGIGAFTKKILTARIRMHNLRNPASPEDLLRHVIKMLDFKAYLQKSHPEDHEARWANVEELVSQSAEFPVYPLNENDADLTTQSHEALPTVKGLVQESRNPAEEALSDFLANVALTSELQRDDEDDGQSGPLGQVTISTIHAAKGLEWPVVFVPSAYDGCIPHSRAEDNDEERRLLYVAMTRAQLFLCLSCPMKNSQREDATISPFLSEKNVQRLLTNQGPTINTQEIVDAARILRRDCPSEAEVAEASNKLQNREDDLWPLNGEESTETLHPWTSKRDQGDGNLRGAKRQKLTDDDTKSVNFKTQFIAGNKTTMQSSQAFSIPGNIGFTTAAAQMHHIHEETAEKIPVFSKSSRHESKGQSTKPGLDQGCLLSLWGIKADYKKTQTRGTPASSKLLTAGPEALPTRTANTGSLQTDGPRIPLAAIPQPMASHRLQADIVYHRPLQISAEEDTAPQAYMFLSSSPPPPETLPGVEEYHDEQPAQPSSESKTTDSTPQDQSYRPANTFHTTSISQVQARMGVPKKTLGVRRRMNGWPGGLRQGFSVPRMTNPQR